MKNFFRHWHYGIKARVIDGALVAHIDTAREPTFVRLDLARLQTVALDVAMRTNEYELNLVNIGAPGATTTLAKFEVKDAAEEAACAIRKALLNGSQTHRFRRAFKTTLGVLAALALLAIVFAALEKLDGGKASPEQASMQSLVQSMQQSGAIGQAAAPATPASPGQPMSAEEFLANTPGTAQQAPNQ